MSNFDDLFDPAPQNEDFDKEAWAAKKKAERDEVYALADATADEICTDGSGAYMLEEQTLQILTAGDGGSVTAEEVRLAEIQSGEQLKAVYRDGETLLVVVGTESETRLLTYDISALEQPELLGTVSQEGEYVDSAEWNGSVQLVTKAAVTLPETSESSSTVRWSVC